MSRYIGTHSVKGLEFCPGSAPAAGDILTVSAGATASGPGTLSSFQLNGVFGSGLDGVATFDGSTAVTGATRSGSTYTLARDVSYSSATVSTGVTVNTGGFRMFVSGTLTLAGTAVINRDGNPGANASGTSGAVKASGLPSGSVGNVTLGGSGGQANDSPNGAAAHANGTAGGTGASPTSAKGGAGGTGMTGGAGGTSPSPPQTGGAGGAGGNVTTSPSLVSFDNIRDILLPYDIINTRWINGGAGGGNGGSGAGNDGTGSGTGGGAGLGAQGGGVLVLCAAIISASGWTGRISANGGAGGNGGNCQAGGGSDRPGDGGGGGGGGGGVCIVLYRVISAGTLTSGTNVTAAGGAVGNGGAGGGWSASGGTAGSTGTVILMRC
jgi:hypothetical protein